MKREIIKIDEEKCTGCELCIPNCPEGAIQIIDGKARLISDLFCDGLGACIGHCPEDAITVEVREAEPYNEKQVMENIVKQGENTIKAHLLHLREHGEEGYLKEAYEVLEEKGIEVSLDESHQHVHSGCPGSRSMEFSSPEESADTSGEKRPSELTQWPIQLHLIPPMAPHFQGRDILLSADCVAFSVGDFHRDHLKGKSLMIACPKLDSGQDVYVDKLTALIDNANIKSLTVLTMEVPCCSGLVSIAQEAASKASREVPIKWIVVSVRGEIIREDTINVEKYV
jgi:Pyruvate/2-oxoacid:ferredoxin oxidoreductase delta subunit